MAIAPDFDLTLLSASEEDLVASLGARRPEAERMAALRTLAGRGVKKAAPILRRIARSAASIAPMRAAASIALGRDADRANQTALLAALKAPEDEVVRRAAEALGRIGDRKALTALRASTVPREPAAARAHGFARSLISYRLGLGSDLLATRTPPQPLEREEPVEAAPIRAETLARIAPRLPEEVPAIRLAPAGGAALSCERNDFLILPAEAPGEIRRTNAVVGVVLRKADSLGRFSLHLYLMTHPAGGGKLALFGVRPDGTVTHRGELTPGDETHTFRFEALDTRLATPLTLEGRVTTDRKAVTVTRATTGHRANTALSRARVPGKG